MLWRFQTPQFSGMSRLEPAIAEVDCRIKFARSLARSHLTSFPRTPSLTPYL